MCRSLKPFSSLLLGVDSSNFYLHHWLHVALWAYYEIETQTCLDLTQNHQRPLPIMMLHLFFQVMLPTHKNSMLLLPKKKFQLKKLLQTKFVETSILAETGMATGLETALNSRTCRKNVVTLPGRGLWFVCIKSEQKKKKY